VCYGLLTSGITSANGSASRTSGPLIICTEENYNFAMVLLKDVHHVFNHNLHLFPCSSTHDLFTLKRFIFTHLVDSHWIVFQNLELLKNTVCCGLMDILVDIRKWRNEKSGMKNGWASLSIGVLVFFFFFFFL
jgi:hypothetical protein